MRVFLAGATGAIGRPLVARLLDAGHEVTATTRSPERAAQLREGGVEGVVLDAFDAAAVREAVLAARPEVLVHQLTALPKRVPPRKYGAAMEPTNRLREETAPHFVAAARAAGARRVVFQSVSFITRPEGPWIHDETAPLYLDGPGPVAAGARSVAAMERTVADAEGLEGLVLRYGFFYGPGTYYGPGGSTAADVRRRRFPIVGAGSGHFSFVHVDDAAEATVLALDRGRPGVYNVTDDDPAPMREWLPALAQAVGGGRPRRVPAWVARLTVGAYAVHWGTTLRGNSNAKARRELGWVPRHPSWREGFREVFA